MGPSLARNRFSAVATISVPTLGIKGKKITDEERYLETIDPAPSTPAGEPLGEIEVQVSAEVARALIEKSRSSEGRQQGPVPVLETALEDLSEGRETAPPILLQQLPPLLATSYPAELPNPAEKNSNSLSLGDGVYSSVKAAFSFDGRNFPTTIQPERSRDIPVPDSVSVALSSQETTTGTPQHTLSEASSAEKVDQPKDRNVLAPLARLETDLLAETTSEQVRDINTESPKSPSTTNGASETERSRDIPVPDSENDELPSRSISVEKPQHIVSDSSPVEEIDPTRDRTVLAPVETSLLRSRSFAALIDVAVACSFFVLGLLLFPNPPRILPFVFGGLYLLTKDSLGILNGQSVGKKILGLRAVNQRNLTLTGNYKSGLLRNLSWLLAPIEFAVLYVREDEPSKGRRLGDDWAQTKVVAETKKQPRKSKWLL